MKMMKRQQVIDQLRAVYSAMTDETRSMCAVAAELGIFCKGTRDLTDQEVSDRYARFARTRPGATRKELEYLGNQWQLAQQQLLGESLCCDVQELRRETCAGWSGFTNRDLERFYFEVTGQSVQVTS